MSEYSYIGDCYLCFSHVSVSEDYIYDASGNLICEQCSVNVLETEKIEVPLKEK